MSTSDPTPPNIDQRLEAIAHSVELIAQMQLQTEKELKRLGRYIRGIARIVFDRETRLRSLEGDDEEE